MKQPQFKFRTKLAKLTKLTTPQRERITDIDSTDKSRS